MCSDTQSLNTSSLEMEMNNNLIYHQVQPGLGLGHREEGEERRMQRRGKGGRKIDKNIGDVKGTTAAVWVSAYGGVHPAGS